MFIALVILSVILTLIVVGVMVQSRANERLLLSHDSDQLHRLLSPWTRRLGLGEPVSVGERVLPIKAEDVARGHFLKVESADSSIQAVSIGWSMPWAALKTPELGLTLEKGVGWALLVSLEAVDPIARVLVINEQFLALIEEASIRRVHLKLFASDGELVLKLEGALPEQIKLLERVIAWLERIPIEPPEAPWALALSSWLKVKDEGVAFGLLAMLRADERCEEAELFARWAQHPCAAVAAAVLLEPGGVASLDDAQLGEGVAQGLLCAASAGPSRARWFALIKERGLYDRVVNALGKRLLATAKAYERERFYQLDELILALLSEAEHGAVQLSRPLSLQLISNTVEQEEVSRVPIIGVHVGASQIVSVMERLWSLELEEVERVSWARVLVRHCRDEIAAQVLEALYKSFIASDQEDHALTRLSASIAQCDPPLAWLRKMRSALGGERERQLNQLSEEIWQRLALRVAQEGVVSDQEREAFFKGGALLMRRARATDALFKLWREQFIDDPRAPKALLEALIGLSSQVSTRGWGSGPQQQLDALSALLMELKAEWSMHEMSISLWCKLMCFHPLMVPNILALHQVWASLLPAREVAAPIEEELSKGGIKMKPQAWFPLWRWAIEQEQLGALPSLARSAHDEVLDELPRLERAPSFESLWAAMRSAPPLMWALLCPLIAQAPYLQSERELYLLEALRRDERVARDAALAALGQCGSLDVVMPLMELVQGVFVSGELKLYVQRAVAQIQKRHGGTRADGALSLAADPDDRGALSLTQDQGGLKIVEEDPP